MVGLSELEAIGVAQHWPSRDSVVKGLRAYTPSTMDHAVAYNARLDDRNKKNATSWIAYFSRGARRQMDAIADALEDRAAWTGELGESIRDLMFADRMSYFWHGKFRVLFPTHERPLALMDWVFMTNSMAFAFLLGWTEQAIYQGYLTHAALNRGYQPRASYLEHHRRAHAFMLRLFADWRGNGVSHDWPAWGRDVPVYNGILERWRDPDPRVLMPWLLAACDRHTHESNYDTEERQFDFGDYRLTRTPVEILLVLRLREHIGLPNPLLDHPLMEPPFDRFPELQPQPAFDELMQGALRRARADWPQFDEATSVQLVIADSLG